MATTTYTEDEVNAQATGALSTSYPNYSVSPEAFLGQFAADLAQLIAALQYGIAQADRDGVPASVIVNGILTARCSTTRLDEWSKVYALPSNIAPGATGRNGPTTATGGGAPITGAPTTMIPSGALLVDASGLVQIELVNGVTIPSGGSIPGLFQATSPGSSGNLAAGSYLRWVSPVPGVSPTVQLTTPITGGADAEDDLTLLMRLLRWLQSPPHGGTAADIRRWAEQSTNSSGASLGILRAYVYRWRNGVGSTDVVITQGGSGQARDPDYGNATPIVTPQVQAFIDSQRIAGDTIRVVRPYFPSNLGLTILYKVVPTPSNAFDWADGGGIVSISVSTTTATLVTATIPASLSAAISAQTHPRLQILLPSSSPLPYQPTVASAAVSGSNTILTFDAPLPAAPGAGAIVFAGGGAVAPVSLAALAYVDSLGPSQQSGYNDVITDSWQSNVTIAGLAAAALNAQDATGRSAILYIPEAGIDSGVQIIVNGGSPGSGDILTFDNAPPNGPQLAWTQGILVRSSA